MYTGLKTMFSFKISSSLEGTRVSTGFCLCHMHKMHLQTRFLLVQLESLAHCEEWSGAHRKSVYVLIWTRPQAGWLVVIVWSSGFLVDLFLS